MHLGLGAPNIQGAAWRHRRWRAAGSGGSRAEPVASRVSAATPGGAACRMMDSSPRIVRVLPVPGGPCSIHKVFRSFRCLRPYLYDSYSTLHVAPSHLSPAPQSTAGKCTNTPLLPPASSSPRPFQRCVCACAGVTIPARASAGGEGRRGALKGWQCTSCGATRAPEPNIQI